jgi:hypothetical protein
MNARQGIERAHQSAKRLDLALLHQVGLVDEDDVGESDLLTGLLVVELTTHMPGID